MTDEQFIKVEDVLVGVIDCLSEGVVDSLDGQAIAALTQSLVSLEAARQSAQGGQ